MISDHDHSMLGAYALGALDPREAELVHEHLAGCADCQREVADMTDLRSVMDDVPPEAFLDGPPEGGDLLLRRTLRAARVEYAGQLPEARPVRRRGLVAAAAVILIAAALTGGIVVGRQTAPQGGVAQSNPANTVHASATDPSTGAKLSVDVVKQTGWVRLHAETGGIQAGEPCQLVVKSRDGGSVLAGSWLVSATGAKNGTVLEGSALVDPGNVKSVDVVTTDGRKLVSVPI
jgi:anti-sigma factor RsiW